MTDYQSGLGRGFGLGVGLGLPPSLFELPPSHEASVDESAGQAGSGAGSESVLPITYYLNSLWFCLMVVCAFAIPKLSK